MCLQCRRPGFDPWFQEDPLEKEMETHSSILAWRIPWTEKVKGMIQVWENIVVTERMGFPGVSDGKESACSAGDTGSIPGLGRSAGEGNGNPVQYSRLGNSMDREA